MKYTQDHLQYALGKKPIHQNAEAENVLAAHEAAQAESEAVPQVSNIKTAGDNDWYSTGAAHPADKVKKRSGPGGE